MPSSRALAGDLGVSRRLVVEAYAQLLAEGYLVARQGAGTYVAATPRASTTRRPAPSPSGAPQFDFFPGAPDLAAFPRTLWLRAMREVLRTAPDGAFAYPDARGAPELRRALSAYLRRVRGVVVEPDAIVVCAGATQGLALLGRALVAQRRRRRSTSRTPGCRRIAPCSPTPGCRCAARAWTSTGSMSPRCARRSC